jgi:hypothetical protein
MKTLKLSLIIGLCFIVIPVIKCQECKMFFPSKEGAVIELTSYDAKNKVTGTTHQKIIGKENITNGYKIKFESETFDKKGQSQFKGQYTVKCENGTFYFEMNSMMSGESMKNYKEGDVEIKGDDLDMPSNLAVGQTLKDGTLTISMKNQAMQMMNMTMSLKNRKVEAIETITTPAGTFECYKITYDVETKMMFNMKSKGVQWIAKDVGMVKSESYDKNGKLAGSSQLTALKN